MRILTVALALVGLSACSGDAGIDPHTWTCASLIDPVMEMSQDRSPKVLEITNPSETSNLPGSKIECIGSAEWSQGEGAIMYGAHVSAGGEVILEYHPPQW